MIVTASAASSWCVLSSAANVVRCGTTARMISESRERAMSDEREGGRMGSAAAGLQATLAAASKSNAVSLLLRPSISF
jgi:hypothetical protein